MTLRKKTFLFIGLACACLIACLFVISLTITREGFTDIEEKEIRRDVDRALNIIENEITMLDDTAHDFAIWDETYAYMKSGDMAYIRDNIRDSAFTKLRVNYILFVNNAGKIVFGKSFDLKNGGEIPFTKALQEEMAVNSLLTSHANSERSVAGVMLLPDGPMIVSSWPILTSEMDGPIRGTLIMGRSLDNFKIRQFASITKLSLVMHHVGDKQMPPDIKDASAYLSSDTPIIIKRLNKDIVAGYAVIKDIFGKPALILRVDQPRSVYKQSRSTIDYLMISLFIIAVIFTLVAVLLMEKFVLQRLAKLSSGVRQVASSGQFSQRVYAAGKDELADLAHDINGMLEKIESLEKFKEETNEARYRAVVEDQTELICRYLPDGTITFANDACCRYFGIEKNICIWLNIISLIPEGYEEFRKRIVSFHAEKPVAIRECLFHADNDIRWLQWTDRAMFDREGNIIEFQSVGREITELKKAEAALHQLVELGSLISAISSNFINQASEEIDVGINQALKDIGMHVGADRSNVFLFSGDKGKISNTHEWCAEGITPHMKDLQNYSIIETLPGNAPEIEKGFYIPKVAAIPPEAYREKMFFESRGIRSLVRVPMVYRGSLIGLLGFDSVIAEKEWSEELINALKIVGTIFVNALERKRAEETLHKTEMSLRQTQKMEAIGTLAGGIAHDFNNILGAIIGNTEIILYGCKDETITKRLGQVLQACDRAKDLVNQILAFSHQRDQEKMPVDIGMIVKEALKLLRSSIPSTISIVTDISSTPNVVFADPTQIHQILMNLCSNAAHAMRYKGGVLKICLERIDYDSMALAANINLKPGAYGRLIISDTGHGIDPAIMDRIFDPFFTTKKIGEGTGLGLSVVYGIAQSHGGTITVYSEPEKGTTFKVYLPLIEEMVPVKGETEEQIPLGNECILFVDDEESLVTISQEMLRTLGYDVVARTSSLEALTTFTQEPARFDLVISDMTMPAMTGVELSREILRLRPDIPVIICTGFSELIDENQARDLGIQRLLIKPLFLKELARTLREILDKK